MRNLLYPAWRPPPMLMNAAANEQISLTVTHPTLPIPVGGFQPTLPDRSLTGRKKPRLLPVKLAHTVVGPEMRRDMISVKFKNGLKLAVEKGVLRNLQTNPDATILPPSGIDLQTKTTAAQSRMAVDQQLLMLPTGQWQTTPDAPSSDVLDAARATAEANLNEELADLNLYLNFAPPSPSEISFVIDQLNALDIVEFASPMYASYIPTSPPDSTHYQLYLKASSKSGVGALWAWSTYLNNGLGSHGENIKFCDVDFGFNNANHDLPYITVLGGVNDKSNSQNTDHGSAALGVLLMVPNSSGGTGIS